MNLGALREMTVGHGVQSPEHFDSPRRAVLLRMRGGRPVKVPSFSAYSTMETLRTAAIAKSQARLQKRTALQERVLELFETPTKMPVLPLADDEADEGMTEKKAQELLRDLQASEFRTYFCSLLKLARAGLTRQQADRFGFGKAVRRLHSRPNCSCAETKQNSSLFELTLIRDLTAIIRVRFSVLWSTFYFGSNISFLCLFFH